MTRSSLLFFKKLVTWVRSDFGRLAMTSDPMPRRLLIMPLSESISIARRAVARETPYCSMSSDSDGMRSPTAYTPLMMSWNRMSYS